MNQELARFEEMKQQEIRLQQQVYEQKIYYLEAKINVLLRDCNAKDQQIRENSLNMSTQKIDEANKELERERQQYKQNMVAIQLQQEQELLKLRGIFAQEIANHQNQLRNKDQIIAQLQSEIQYYQTNSKKQMDEAKIQYLSQIIDLTKELSAIC